MRMYALRDANTGLYHRPVYDGRPEFTTRPYVITTDRKWLEYQARRLGKEWKRYGYKQKPVLKVEAFEVTSP